MNYLRRASRCRSLNYSDYGGYTHFHDDADCYGDGGDDCYFGGDYCSDEQRDRSLQENASARAESNGSAS